MSEKINTTKLKILYNADILAHWCSDSASRSGIFFVALNILKELLKRDNIKLTLTCSIMHYQSVLKLSKEYFCNYDIKILITDVPEFIAHIIPYNNKIIKAAASAENPSKIKNDKLFKKIIKKFLFHVVMNPIKHILSTLNYVKLLFINKKYDIYFSPYSKIPFWAQNNRNLKKYTVLYDTIPALLPDYSCEKVKTGGWYLDLVNSFNKEYFYFAISENTKQDFLKLYGKKLDSEKIYVTPLACNENFTIADESIINQAKAKYHIPNDKKYIFSLCTLEPRKNLLRAVKTFVEFIKKNKIDNLVFVLGGGHWDEFITILNNEIAELDIYKSKIIKIGYVEDKDLAALYSGAEWFVYTSMYEGFGLPPLEAMSCGCPVITSNNSSLPEVVGEAGIMINYDSDDEHIRAYENYYYNKDLREKNKINGIKRAKQFSWEKCVDIIYEQFYREINESKIERK